MELWLILILMAIANFIDTFIFSIFVNSPFIKEEHPELINWKALIPGGSIYLMYHYWRLK